jgi:hypothetical protein
VYRIAGIAFSTGNQTMGALGIGRGTGHSRDRRSARRPETALPALQDAEPSGQLGHVADQSVTNSSLFVHTAANLLMTVRTATYVAPCGQKIPQNEGPVSFEPPREGFPIADFRLQTGKVTAEPQTRRAKIRARE